MASHWALPLFSLAALVCLADSQVKTSGDGVISFNGNIVKMNLVCPDKIGLKGYLEVTSDMNMAVVAICANGKRNFTRINSATQRLIIDLNAGDIEPHLCSLEKRLMSQTYSLLVHGGWGEAGREVMIPELRRTVVCAYDNYTQTEKQKPVMVKDYIIAPKDIHGYMGPMMNLKVDMSLVNIVGASLDGKHTNLGKLVRLKAHALDHISTIKPLSCYASNNSGKKYYILRAGCGDGLVFRRKVGFTFDYKTLTSWSPYFHSFSLPQADAIYFMCHFVICNSNCGNNSCENERRRKRDMPSAKDLNIQKYKDTDTATGYVIVRKLYLNGRLSNIDPTADFIGMPHRTSENFANVKIFAVLGVLGAMLVGTMCMLLIICVRQTTPLQATPQSPNAKPPQELSNLASA